VEPAQGGRGSRTAGPSTPADARHRPADVPGGRIHWSSRAPARWFLPVHGFPGPWYSWRHQLPALAAAGHRAVAVDVRGYGRSCAPDDVEAYRIGVRVEDNAVVVRALDEETAVIVGHGRGSSTRLLPR